MLGKDERMSSGTIHMTAEKKPRRSLATLADVRALTALCRP